MTGGRIVDGRCTVSLREVRLRKNVPAERRTRAGGTQYVAQIRGIRRSRSHARRRERFGRAIVLEQREEDRAGSRRRAATGRTKRIRGRVRNRDTGIESRHHNRVGDQQVGLRRREQDDRHSRRGLRRILITRNQTCCQSGQRAISAAESRAQRTHFRLNRHRSGRQRQRGATGRNARARQPEHIDGGQIQVSGKVHRNDVRCSGNRVR